MAERDDGNSPVPGAGSNAEGDREGRLALAELKNRIAPSVSKTEPLYDLSSLPCNVKQLIAAFAHPIHPCHERIQFFDFMTDPLGDCSEDVEGVIAQWDLRQLHAYRKWNTRLQRNGHVYNNYDENDANQQLEQSTNRLLIMFKLAEMPLDFRRMFYDVVIRSFEQMGEPGGSWAETLFYSVPDSLGELFRILDNH